MKKKFIIVTTAPISLYFFSGQIQTLKEIFDVEVVSSSGNLLDNFCESEEIIGHIVEMKREISLINDLKSLFSMFYFFYKNSPDIFMVIHLKPVLYPWYQVGWRVFPKEYTISTVCDIQENEDLKEVSLSLWNGLHAHLLQIFFLLVLALGRLYMRILLLERRLI